MQLDLSELRGQNTSDLVVMARSLGIDGAGRLERQELIHSILRANGKDTEDALGEGVLEILPDGFGFLRTPDQNFLPGPDDIYVSPSQIRRFNLRTGDHVRGRVRAPKDGERYYALIKIEAINSGLPATGKDTLLFDSRTPVHPDRPLVLERSGTDESDEDLDWFGGSDTEQLLDLFCPLGFGQRVVLGAPPRAGRTTLLRQLVRSCRYNHPDVSVLVLLVDERPEEVTEMRRALDALDAHLGKGTAEVLSSTFDEPAARHVQVADMALERAKRQVEQGRDVILLLDSLTRLVRAFHAVAPVGGKQVSGVVDASALHRARRLFGAGRNLEEGGSLTIVASVLVGTDARIDEVLLEELQGVANAEVWLDRTLAERRIFPAIDLGRSVTRRVERALDSAAVTSRQGLRDRLSGDLAEDLQMALEWVQEHEDNAQLLDKLGRTGK
ncbi:MAG: transcription termination factor Rho [Myxococcota bacterium]|jgi:transcription termination factor Rho|nr:transcription termination factor Rho [Myxococcota bacterium]